jgi:hypothetical protein
MTRNKVNPFKFIRHSFLHHGVSRCEIFSLAFALKYIHVFHSFSFFFLAHRRHRRCRRRLEKYMYVHILGAKRKENARQTMG